MTTPAARWSSPMVLAALLAETGYSGKRCEKAFGAGVGWKAFGEWSYKNATGNEHKVNGALTIYDGQLAAMADVLNAHGVPTTDAGRAPQCKAMHGPSHCQMHGEHPECLYYAGPGRDPLPARELDALNRSRSIKRMRTEVEATRRLGCACVPGEGECNSCRSPYQAWKAWIASEPYQAAYIFRLWEAIGAFPEWPPVAASLANVREAASVVLRAERERRMRLAREVDESDGRALRIEAALDDATGPTCLRETFSRRAGRTGATRGDPARVIRARAAARTAATTGPSPPVGTSTGRKSARNRPKRAPVGRRR